MIRLLVLAAALLSASAIPPAPLDAAPASLSLVCDSLLVAPLGLAWSPTGPGPPAPGGGRCVEFRSEYGGGEFKRPVDLWLQRCAVPLAGGSLERRVYQMGDDPEPRWGVVFWSIRVASGADSSADQLASLRRAMIDSLARRLGPGRERPPESALDGLGRSWKHPVHEFTTPAGLLRVYRAEDTWSQDSLLVAHWFAPLAAEEKEDWSPQPTADSELPFEAQRTRERRHEAADALGSRDRALQAALRAPAPAPAGLDAVRAALTEARTLRAGERRDLLVWATHLWLASLGSLTDGSEAARSQAAQVAAAFAPLGVTFHPGDDDTTRLYRGSLAAALMLRLGKTGWADHAFAERLNSGWDSTGTGAYQWDAFRFIIARGEPFLREYPRSAAWREVALLVAQAHETAWSLARSDGAEALTEPAVDPAAAEPHRRRALALYKGLVGGSLPEAGIGPWWWPGYATEQAARQRDLRRRIRRLELEIDTGGREHVYFSC